MTILSLDCGKTTGWARSDRRNGVLSLGIYVDEGEALVVFQRWLADQLDEDRPELLLIERAFFSSRIRNADFTSALIRAAHGVAWSLDVPRRELSANTVRKAVFGRITVSDRERVAQMRAMGWELASDHAADAAALIAAHDAGAGRMAA